MIRTHVEVPDLSAMGRLAGEMTDEIEEEVHAHVNADVHAILNARIKHPTPYYETQIVTERAGGGLVVHDSGVIYGPWLEGTGSRNAPVTRFKGYHAFRDAEAAVVARLGMIIEPIMRKWIARMNG